MPVTRSSGSAPLPALDGLRAISILLVLAAHAGFERIVPGGLGVTIFFFVSGFLITRQLVAERAGTGGIGMRPFYVRRALRLAPAACAYVAISGALFIVIGGRVGLAAWIGATLQLSNILQVFSRSFETNLPGTPHPFSILWSLAIEEHFYLAWPFLFAALAQLRGGRLLVPALIVSLAAALAWRMALHPLCTTGLGPHLVCGLHADDRIYKSTDTRFDSIAWGALAALLRARPDARREAAPRLAAILALLACILCRDPWFRDTLRYTLLGAALLILVPPLTRAPPAVRLLDAAPMVAIGRLSYSLYLWHWCALMLAGRLASGRPVFLLLYTGLTILLALLSWFAIERPMMRLRRRAGSEISDRLVPNHRPKQPHPAPVLPGDPLLAS